MPCVRGLEPAGAQSGVQPGVRGEDEPLRAAEAGKKYRRWNGKSPWAFQMIWWRGVPWYLWELGEYRGVTPDSIMIEIRDGKFEE